MCQLRLSFGQHHDRLAVAPGKDLRSAASRHGSHIGAQVLARRDAAPRRRPGTRRPNTCSVLCVTPGRIAMSPYGIDFVDVLQVPVRAARSAPASRPVSSATSRDRGLAPASRPSSWLPVTDCQNPGWSARSSSRTSSCRRVDDDQRRDRDLVSRAAHTRILRGHRRRRPRRTRAACRACGARATGFAVAVHRDEAHVGVVSRGPAGRAPRAIAAVERGAALHALGDRARGERAHHELAGAGRGGGHVLAGVVAGARDRRVAHAAHELQRDAAGGSRRGEHAAARRPRPRRRCRRRIPDGP